MFQVKYEQTVALIKL